MKVHTTHYQVYLEDTDMMGIVYHANYLRFFERARTDALSDYGFSLTQMANDDTYFAIRTLSIVYYAPARLGERLAIATKLKPEGKTRVIFSQSMCDSQDNRIASLEVDVVCVNGKIKPKRLPSKMIKEWFV